MGEAVRVTDELVAEWLAFRGFASTVASFDSESANPRDGYLQAEKIVETILQAIENHDIKKLKTLWTWLNERILSGLDEAKMKAAKEYENDTLRLYLVRCIQANRKNEAVNFFQVMASIVVNNSEWTQWFAFPYVPEPREHSQYKRYFSRVWQENFTISLYNFFSLVTGSLALPRLARTVAAVDPNSSYGREGLNVTGSPTNLGRAASNSFDDDVIDDFALIPQYSTVQSSSNSKPTLKNIFKNITGKNRNAD